MSCTYIKILQDVTYNQNLKLIDSATVEPLHKGHN